ncbi:unnamed protein product [Allacma fusca]|uniref:Uncharacterized protein n=1 Tax=Allacma fusca TaxID=39272 RepID=A0A8J2J3A6_9HEXA|nr:unnamed protein product [Allacma fusca]
MHRILISILLITRVLSQPKSTNELATHTQLELKITEIVTRNFYKPIGNLDHCTLSLTNPPEVWTSSFLKTSSKYYLANLQFSNQTQKFDSVPQFSSVCQHVLVWVSKLISAALKQSFVLQQATSANYIFIGDQSQIEQVQEQIYYSQLKYKICIKLPGAKFQVNKMFPTDQQIFTGVNLRVGLIPMEPQTILGEDKIPIAGYCFKFMETMTTRYNFTAKYYHKWGRLQQYPNGTWGGPLGDLLYDRLDAYVGLVHNFERHPWVSFSTNILMVHLYFLTTFPHRVIKWEATFYPFDAHAWIVIFVTALLTTVVFLSYPEQKQNTMISQTIFTFCAMLQQSVKKLPRPSWLAIVFLFYSIVISCCYNSNLISFLTFPEEEFIPRTAEELAEAQEYRIIFMHFPGGAGDSYFKHSESPVFVSLRNRFEYERDFLKCVTEAVLNPKTACLAWNMISSGLLAKNLSLLSTSFTLYKSEPIISSTANVGLPKESKYFDLINQGAGWLQNTGHFHRWNQDALRLLKQRGRSWLLTRKNGSLYRQLERLMGEVFDMEKMPLDLRSFVVPFTTLFIGAILGSLIWLLEIVSFYMESQKQLRNCYKIFSTLTLSPKIKRWA